MILKSFTCATSASVKVEMFIKIKRDSVSNWSNMNRSSEHLPGSRRHLGFPIQVTRLQKAIITSQHASAVYRTRLIFRTELE